MTTQWPPRTKHTDETTPRRLRTWNFTRDGPFWGSGVLAALVWLSVMAYVAVLVVQNP